MNNEEKRLVITITGPAASGKTQMIEQIMESYQGESVYWICGPATLKRIHSIARFGAANVLVWDEIPEEELDIAKRLLELKASDTKTPKALILAAQTQSNK